MINHKARRDAAILDFAQELYIKTIAPMIQSGEHIDHNLMISQCMDAALRFVIFRQDYLQQKDNS